MVKLSALLALFMFLVPTGFTAELGDGFVVVQLEDMNWDASSDAVQQRVLYGDPSSEGFYIIRVRFPAGGSSRPHYHSQDRFVTVIEGIWNAGIDASHDMTNTTAIPAGGFMFHPAGNVHYDGSRSGPVVVEIRGMGPVNTTSVEITP
ncbi:MAG: hypothetical protein COA96_11830 [SAR86 cluster bacterium]|uniref:ChrR-like cupin domain-containing protein n=1 Tax=SAR86 cluster bacterium TaxID=2030880 RepID=A0A2A5AVW3_9GAMM|nr:MAG: hypothetical protein COA96_11830 [SAR86 cluster bacterium]